ncbi:MAG: lipopolysaccharide transport periplasmic protein LptA [Desulfuromonadales bacterium C00003094]|jgi:lipopolysaccharide export system protein LptA|nr:MAG: lipopolysaccharide transport periplasmic protein LptA [Desulfuromonadales bacterium C00003094]OEU77377.1 MAG: lipopolysaccharide transport periplasmic protein LptA [Desulfuromonadales bacterium C00003107]
MKDMSVCRISVLLLLLLLTLFVGGRGSIAFAGQEGGGSEAIEITSRRLEADQAAGTVRFIGDVVAVQGDTTIRAEELILYQASEGQRIDRIEAFRQVRIEQGERVATGQKAVLNKALGQVVLTGSPKVRQGADFVEGDEIVFFLDSERSIVRSKGSERVKAVFHPRERTSE